MTIKEVEQITGLTRSNIRFYEKEKLITPDRNENNGYREYSEEDIKTIKKVAYLRTLGISIEDIRRIANKEIDLFHIVKAQRKKLDQQLSELENAKILCDRMLSSNEKMDYENLDMEQFVTDVQDYWSENNDVFKIDTVSFFYMWGGNITWGILALLSLLIAVFSFRYLPAEIPVQWSGDTVSSFVNKQFIFAFPAICIIIRFVLRPFIWRWLKMNIMDSEPVTDYITNYLCFIALSVETFIILYVKGIVKYVTVLLFVDTIVLLGGLLKAVWRTTGKRRKKS